MARKRLIHVATLGARRHYAVPKLLNELGFLGCFFTDFYAGNKNKALITLLEVLSSYGGSPSLMRLLGRRVAGLNSTNVKSFDLMGLKYIWALKRASAGTEIDDIYREVAARFASNILGCSDLEKSVVWAFKGAAQELFEGVVNKDVVRVLDQISNPGTLENALARTELENYGHWVKEDSLSLNSSYAIDRELKEWSLADRIVVGSPFVKEGLLKCNVDEDKIAVIPSGVDTSQFQWVQRGSFKRDRPLRVLFVGRVSILKGVQYLLEAVSALGGHVVEARFAGAVSVKERYLSKFASNCEFLGAVPRNQISDHYKWADVFCFPSITEGSAAVTYEALCSGLPVITTPNAGSIVTDRVNGFVIPVSNASRIEGALLSYWNDPEMLAAHQFATYEARTSAGIDRYKWDLNAFASTIVSL